MICLGPLKAKILASPLCTEMVMPIGHGGNDTMFEASPFDLKNLTRTCQAVFGVTPRPHWITTEFGGHVSFLLIQTLHWYYF